MEAKEAKGKQSPDSAAANIDLPEADENCSDGMWAWWFALGEWQFLYDEQTGHPNQAQSFQDQFSGVTSENTNISEVGLEALWSGMSDDVFSNAPLISNPDVSPPEAVSASNQSPNNSNPNSEDLSNESGSDMTIDPAEQNEQGASNVGEKNSAPLTTQTVEEEFDAASSETSEYISDPTSNFNFDNSSNNTTSNATNNGGGGGGNEGGGQGGGGGGGGGGAPDPVLTDAFIAGSNGIHKVYYNYDGAQNAFTTPAAKTVLGDATANVKEALIFNVNNDANDYNDLVVFSDNVGLEVFINDGAGNYTANGAVNGISGVSVAIGDANNDSVTDLFVNKGNALEVWHNDGFGSFTQNVGTGITVNDFEDIAVGHFNGDNVLDIFFLDDAGNSQIWKGMGDGTYQHFLDLNTLDGNSIEVSDITENGSLDLVVNDGTSIKVYNNDGFNFFTDSGFSFSPTGFNDIDLHALNESDNDIDLFVLSADSALNATKAFAGINAGGFTTPADEVALLEGEASAFGDLL